MALGEPAGGTAWTVRIQVKPFMAWIWSGCLLMALGGLLAAGDRRYRQEAARAPLPRSRADAVPATPREGY